MCDARAILHHSCDVFYSGGAGRGGSRGRGASQLWWIHHFQAPIYNDDDDDGDDHEEGPNHNKFITSLLSACSIQHSSDPRWLQSLKTSDLQADEGDGDLRTEGGEDEHQDGEDAARAWPQHAGQQGQSVFSGCRGDFFWLTLELSTFFFAGGKTAEQKSWCGGGGNPVVQVSLSQVLTISINMMIIGCDWTSPVGHPGRTDRLTVGGGQTKHHHHYHRRQYHRDHHRHHHEKEHQQWLLQEARDW